MEYSDKANLEVSEILQKIACETYTKHTFVMSSFLKKPKPVLISEIDSSEREEVLNDFYRHYRAIDAKLWAECSAGKDVEKMSWLEGDQLYLDFLKGKGY